MKRIIGLVIICMAFIAMRQSFASPSDPITDACYYAHGYHDPDGAGHVRDCALVAANTLEMLKKIDFSCASLVYVVSQRATQTIRCRGYDNSVIDYQYDSEFNTIGVVH